MQGTKSTLSVIDHMLRESNLSLERLSLILREFGIEKGCSAASFSRHLERGKIPNELDEKVRPIVLKLENLARLMAPLKPSFADPESTATMLRIIDACTVRVEISPKGLEQDQEETI